MMVLLTGASGFLGNEIKKKLKDHKLITLGRKETDIIADLQNTVPAVPEVEMVIHAAGKAHFIPRNDKEAEVFQSVNVNGTKNLLQALEQSGFKGSFIFISSVSVYGKDHGKLIDETCSLGATDPYGRSKIEAEKLISSWCNKHSIKYTILRLPLLVGYDPPGNLGQMVRWIKHKRYFNIAGGNASKSMVLASDVAATIVKAAAVGGVYNLTDGYHPSFKELSYSIADHFGVKRPYSISGMAAAVLAFLGDYITILPVNSIKLSKMTTDLTFDDTKARQSFNWNPKSVLAYFHKR